LSLICRGKPPVFTQYVERETRDKQKKLLIAEWQKHLENRNKNKCCWNVIPVERILYRHVDLVFFRNV